jgi:DNA-binding NarL/FixJ family response regulator
MASMVRILLIDDHALFREAIARVLAAQPDFRIAGECATVEEGLEVVKKEPVDVVLLDINLGSQQGGAFLNLARAEGYQGNILVVTAGVSKFEATRLMQRGCCGIFLKHERPQLLIESIRGIAKGERTSVPALNQQQFAEAVQENQRPLTRRERQVLRGVFGGRTNKEIAYDLGVSEPLVKAVVQQLFAKTGVRNRSQLVRAAVEQYWKEVEETAEDR